MFHTAEIVILIGLQSVINEQWGTFSAGASEVLVTYPMSYTSQHYATVAYQYNKEENTNVRKATCTGFYAYCHGGTPTSQGYISLGK